MEVLTDPVERVQDEIKAKRYPDMTAKFEQMRQREEKHRLEREVIEAAKKVLVAYDAPSYFGWESANATANLKLRMSVRNLNEFESNQLQVKK